MVPVRSLLLLLIFLIDCFCFWFICIYNRLLLNVICLLRRIHCQNLSFPPFYKNARNDFRLRVDNYF